MANEKEIKVPDIGGASGVDVIEILVQVGDEISKDTPLVTLESDKASMEIPSPEAGIVRSLCLKLGDKVSEGDVILLLEATGVAEALVNAEEATALATQDTEDLPASNTQVSPVAPKPLPLSAPLVSEPAADRIILAGPAVRRLARELGVDLSQVVGSGVKSRVSKEDVHQFVKTRLHEKSVGGLSFPTAPSIDFSKFGEITVKPLNKIKRATGVNVHRAWVSIPHVTQFDEADITELEAFRKAELESLKKSGVKLTILAFVCKVVSRALQEFPEFNTSLDASGEQLIYKNYINIGVAVETPNGLVVPVIKSVNTLSVQEVALEMARLSEKARDKGLMPADMSGGCFTISSLGGIGGTAFTPIVNSPEVAILGLSRSAIKPVYLHGEFQPRLMLPLSLSYDHRVIDGAQAARFTRFLSECLSDIRKILL